MQAQLFAEKETPFLHVQKIALSDVQNKKVQIQLHAKPLTLLVFLSPECPMCRNYTIVLNNLQTRFQQKVQVLGIVPGDTYEKDAVRQFKKDYKVQYALLSDPGKELADYLKATITPEVVLLNAEGTLVYRGAIDDWLEELGKKKLKPQKHYLQNAIAQYISGSPVLITQTNPKGCYINEF